MPASAEVALIKIDVEGAELGVLQGATAVLERCRPYVIVEHGVRAGAQETDSHRLWRYFDARGVAVFTIDGRGPLSLAAFLDVRQMWNFLARPW